VSSRASGTALANPPHRHALYTFCRRHACTPRTCDPDALRLRWRRVMGRKTREQVWRKVGAKRLCGPYIHLLSAHPLHFALNGSPQSLAVCADRRLIDVFRDDLREKRI
jgi:hypothetical protein